VGAGLEKAGQAVELIRSSRLKCSEHNESNMRRGQGTQVNGEQFSDER